MSSHAESNFREVAVYVISELGHRHLVPILQKLMLDSDPDVATLAKDASEMIAPAPVSTTPPAGPEVKPPRSRPTLQRRAVSSRIPPQGQGESGLNPGPVPARPRWMRPTGLAAGGGLMVLGLALLFTREVIGLGLVVVGACVAAVAYRK
jgi:hypothetical protein